MEFTKKCSQKKRKKKCREMDKWDEQRKEPKWEPEAKKSSCRAVLFSACAGNFWVQGRSHPGFSRLGTGELKYLCSRTHHIHQFPVEGCLWRDINYQAFQESRLWQPGQPSDGYTGADCWEQSRPRISAWKWWRVEMMWRKTVPKPEMFFPQVLSSHLLTFLERTSLSTILK